MEQAVERCPNHAQSYQAWACLEAKIGNLQKAKSLTVQVFSLFPSKFDSCNSWDHLDHLFIRSFIHSFFGFQGLRNAPNHPALWTIAGLVEARMNNIVKARKIFNSGTIFYVFHSVFGCPKSRCHLSLSFALSLYFTYPSAIARFPSHGALYKVMGELEVRQSSYIEARRIFRNGISNDPNYAPLYHSAALLEAKIGNLEVID